MAKRTVRDPRTGDPVEGEVVKVKSVDDPPIIVTLEDGSVLRLRMDIYEAVRIPDGYDADGSPLYQLRHSGMLSVVQAPPELRQQ